MKKVFVVLMFLGIISSGFAQNYIFGLKGGVNISNLNNVKNSNTRTGFVGGIYFEYPLSYSASLVSETVISQQGAAISNPRIGDVKLTYLNWPILLKANMTKNFNLIAGPQVGFLLSGKGGYLPRSSYRTVEVGIACGFGFRVTEGVELQARYIQGLTHMNKVNNAKNNAFQFGIAFDLQ